MPRCTSTHISRIHNQPFNRGRRSPPSTTEIINPNITPDIRRLPAGVANGT
ncbi:hypothetical protein WKK05_09040 [Nostoc sp. UHCC 0302]